MFRPRFAFRKNMLALNWLSNTRAVMDDIQATQLPAIRRAAELDGGFHRGRTVGAYVRLRSRDDSCRGDVSAHGGFVGFHPMVELPLTFFTRVTGEMGIHQFLFLERAEGYGRAS